MNDQYVNKAEEKDKRRTEAEWTVKLSSESKMAGPDRSVGERRLALTNGRPLPKRQLEQNPPRPDEGQNPPPTHRLSF